jgi:hypothetical protein
MVDDQDLCDVCQTLFPEPNWTRREGGKKVERIG